MPRSRASCAKPAARLAVTACGVLHWVGVPQETTRNSKPWAGCANPAETVGRALLPGSLEKVAAGRGAMRRSFCRAGLNAPMHRRNARGPQA